MLLIESASKKSRRTLFFKNHKMKKFYLPFIALILVFFVSCRDQKTASEIAGNEFQQGLTSQDSIKVLQMSDSCMAFLKAGQIEEALNMLFEYDDSLKQVSPLSMEARAQYMKKIMMFPVIDYSLSYFSFTEEGLNDVKYKVVFGPVEAGAPKTAYMFNPVKNDGNWYLCVKSSTQAVDSLLR